MPLLFLIVGTLFLVAAVRGEDQTRKLLDLFKSDFVGPNNFLVWALAIGAVAGIGYIPKMKPLSNIFLALIFIVLLLVRKDASGQDFISSFFRQVRATEGTQ